jgi:general secretion pathway protein I
VRLRPPRRPRRGLTLIEILLSLAIFVMALAALSRLVDMGTDREADARQHAAAARLATSKLAEVEAGAEALTSNSGGFDGADAAWTWQMTAELAGTNLYLVTVTVSRDLKGRPFSLKLSQMVLDPTIKGTAAEAARPDPTGGAP